MSDPMVPFVPLAFERLSEEQMKERAAALFEEMSRRRSIRSFSPEPLPLDVVRAAIHTAGQAPSGAHRQPWTFVLVTDPEVKRKIRLAAEEEEKENYTRRMSAEWRDAVAPFRTDWRKPFLETAPSLIVMFRRDYEVDAEGRTERNYYVQESCGIALGMLIAALHLSGIASLTHTPSPLGFLARILERPPNERAYMLLPVGYPTPDCEVPDLARKPLDQILIEI